MTRRAAWWALVLATSTLVGCKKDTGPSAPASSPDRQLWIHGVVTDSQTHLNLDSVKVTLLGTKESDAGMDTPLLTTESDALGYFRFTGLSNVHNVLVQYEKNGYVTFTKLVNEVTDGGNATAPCATDSKLPCDVPSTVEVADASAELTQQFTLKVAGWVYGGTSVATGATVVIAPSDDPATAKYQMNTDDKGHFEFPAVVPGTYVLHVLPYDRDGNGVSDYQQATLDLGNINATAINLSNIVVNLKDVRHVIEGGSFANLNQPYPLSIDDLMDGDLYAVEVNTKTFTLHFGAEVDPSLTSFELFQYDQVTRISAPIKIETSWDRNTIVTITAQQDLTPSVTGYTSYQLRIRALRFKDGDIAIPASPTEWGVITFVLQQLPAVLANPVPSFYLDAQFNGTRQATKVAVDAAHVWLLDANSDFIFDTDPSANWSSSRLPQLKWTHVGGAVRYHVWGRTVSKGPLGTAQQWQEIADPVDVKQPVLNPAITATINPYQFPVIQDASLPWAFSESVEFAITSEDSAGFQSPIDLTKTFATVDSFGGLITGVEVEPNVVAPFAPSTEQGARFDKTIRIDFSELMNPTALPVIESTNTTVKVESLKKIAWGSKTNPSSVPLNAAQSVYVNATLSIASTCTETLIDRYAGDTEIPVRDNSVFPPEPSSVVTFLNPANGQWYEEVIGLLPPPSADKLVLSSGLSGLTGKLVIPKNSLACLVSPDGPISRVNSVATNSTELNVDKASLFNLGERVLLYTPRVGAQAPVRDYRTIVGLDTENGRVVIDTGASVGHNTVYGTVLMPVPFIGAEYQLRPRIDITSWLTSDVLIGGPETAITVTGASQGTGPALQYLSMRIGDKVLIDLDGDLTTTGDQIVTAVKGFYLFAPAASSTASNFTVALPQVVTLYQHTSKVILLGDSFKVTKVHDTSPVKDDAGEDILRPLDLHRDEFSVDPVLTGGFIY